MKYENDLMGLWEIESAASQSLRASGLSCTPSEYQRAVQRSATQDPRYQAVRSRVACATPRIKRIAQEAGLATEFQSFPAPAVGGPVITVNAFDAVLTDTSHGGVPHQSIVDVLNQTYGFAEDRVRTELYNAFNPFHWLKELIVFVLRIPFLLIQATGFDVAKVEDHLLAKIFKLAELAFVLWLGLKLGLARDDLRAVFDKIAGR